MTPSLKGFKDIQTINVKIKFGNGETLVAEKKGTFHREVQQEGGIRMLITLTEVKYIPNLDCNLMSMANFIKKGYKLIGNESGLALEKGKVRIKFD